MPRMLERTASLRSHRWQLKQEWWTRGRLKTPVVGVAGIAASRNQHQSIQSICNHPRAELTRSAASHGLARFNRQL